MIDRNFETKKKTMHKLQTREIIRFEFNTIQSIKISEPSKTSKSS